MGSHQKTEHSKALTRKGANPGDLIYVTGTLGDAAIGLSVIQSQFKVNSVAE